MILTWNTIKSHNCFQTTQGWRRSKGGCKIITPFELQLTRTTCTLWQSRLCTHPRGHSKTFCHLIHHCNRKQHVDSKYMESLATQNLAQSVRVVIKSLLYTDWCRTTGSLTLSAHKFKNTSQNQLFYFSISYLWFASTIFVTLMYPVTIKNLLSISTRLNTHLFLCIWALAIYKCSLD